MLSRHRLISNIFKVPAVNEYVPVVNTLENETNHLESKQCDYEHRLVFLQFDNVGVERVRKENTVLDNDNKVKQKLAHQSRHMLKGFGPGKKKGVHPETNFSMLLHSTFTTSS